MSEYYAMTWNVRKGTEDEVIALFENYGRPDHTIRDDDGNEIGTPARDPRSSCARTRSSASSRPRA